MRRLKYLFLVFTIFFLSSFCAQSQTNSVGNFKVKGFFIDLRNEVMTISAIKDLALNLSKKGINTLVIEWEATYPYEKHAVLSNELSYSRSEIKSLIAYCKSIGIEIIPMQESFGHVQYILRHDRYSDLRVNKADISQVCACKPTADSLLFYDLFSDMAAMFPSKYIFIGGDETRSLGKSDLCKAAVDSLGVDWVYANYMKMMADIVIKLGKTPVMWADMLLKHQKYADLIPKQTVMVDWNYGWKINHFGDLNQLMNKGFSFWGAPSIRSHPDNWFVTDWKTHLNNQRDYIPFIRSKGFDGVLMTSWSTSGTYSIIWGVGNEVLDMLPIRDNYPMSGFKILIALYTQSLKQQKAINPQVFVTNYAQTRFGFSKNDAERLWRFFMLPPELIVYGKPQKSNSISEMRKRNKKIVDLLYHLKPLKNKKEFEHYRLMSELRDYYLAYKELQSTYNSVGFTRSQVEDLLQKAVALQKKGTRLNSRFYRLNKGYLLEEEIKKQNKIRNIPLERLKQRLIAISKL